MPFDQLIHNRLMQVLVTILLAAVLSIVGRLLIDRLIRRLVRSEAYESPIDERKREDTIITVFHTTYTVLLIIIAVLIILDILSVNIAALVTGAGVFGVVFGLGAQSSIKNYLAGVYILSENQYRVGDIITLSGGTLGPHSVSGVVEEITLRVTKLRDMDGTLNMISNGDAGLISNKTFKFGNVVINLDISYDSDLDAAERVINQVGKHMQADEHWQALIIEPIKLLRIEDFTQGGVLLKVSGKVAPGAQWDVAGEYRRRLKAAFDKKGIEFAVPERIVRNQNISEAEEEILEAEAPPES